MKNIISFFLVTLLSASLLAQTADDIKVHDTRDQTDTPTLYNNEVRFDFKRLSTVNISSSNAYSGMMTIAPWGDNSGNKSHQINFNDDGVLYRSGLPDAGSWGAWNRFLIENSLGQVGIGTSTPSQKLEIKNTNSFNSNMEAQSQDHISLISDNHGINSFWGGVTWKTGNRRRASIVATQENTDSDFVGIAFFTKGTDGPGPMYESMRIKHNGSVGIGTTAVPSGFKLAVKGKALMEEVQVAAAGNFPWPDYVFSDTYQLNPLSEVSTYIQENHHLPGIPTAEEVAENGIKLGEMNAKLLEKIEELTLYLIEMKGNYDSEIDRLRNENKEFKTRLEKLEKVSEP